MLNKTIAPGATTTIHSNPSNADGLINPPSAVNWATTGTDFGVLAIQGAGVGDPLQKNAIFQSTGAVGETTITMECAGITEQVKVTVATPVIPPFDHFAPSFD